MNYRALIFDDEKSIRQMLWLLFDSRGYEVFSWLDQIEGDIDPKRKLADWFLKRMPENSGS